MCGHYLPNMVKSMKLPLTLGLFICLYIASSYCTKVDIDCNRIWEDNLEQANSSSAATVKLTLLHREHPCSPVSTPSLNPSASGLQKYHAHVRRLTDCFSSYPVDEANSSGPIYANGVPWDYYSYVTQIQLGTPAKTQTLLVDIGSSLSWVGCDPCTNGCPGPVFNPDESSTYNVARCGSGLCNAVPSATLSRGGYVAPSQRCSYNQTYNDNSSSVGVVGSDTLTYGMGTQAFFFGCCNLFQGIGGRYSGILGLSVNMLSFFTQLTLGRRYRAMAYCFPHPRKQGFLRFGQYDEHQGILSFIPLCLDGNNYFVHLSEFTVGTSNLLDTISSGNQTMRCFFDTGTPYTMLPRHLFASLSNAVGENIEGFYQVGVSTGQTCFQREMYWPEEDVYIPTARIVFQDGATITLVSEDLMFMEAPDVYCLAFKMNDGGDMVLGSRHLMGVHTVVDLEKMIMGLRDQGCT